MSLNHLSYNTEYPLNVKVNDLRVDSMEVKGESLFNDNIETYGQMKCEQFVLRQRNVKYDGVMTPADINLSGQGSLTVQNWSYQRYADLLAIQGQFTVGSPGGVSFAVTFRLPLGYQCSTNILYHTASGIGFPTTDINTQPQLLARCRTPTPNTCQLYFISSDGLANRIPATTHIVTFSIVLQSIVDV